MHPSTSSRGGDQIQTTEPSMCTSSCDENVGHALSRPNVHPIGRRMTSPTAVRPQGALAHRIQPTRYGHEEKQ
jgi:hypothetical protein